jgi:hypothetical protein
MGCGGSILTRILTVAHFDYSSLFSDAQVEKVGNPEKNVKTEKADKNQTQCHEIEANSSKDRAMYDL